MGSLIGIVNIGLGNIDSVGRAVRYLGYEFKLCEVPGDLDSVDKIIFPGVGSFRAAVAILAETTFDEAIKDQVLKGNKPILGICLGMQLLAQHGSEDGGADGLGLIGGHVELHRGALEGVSIPHIGWNDVHHQGGELYKGIESGTCFYFVHSYELLLDSVPPYVATANHGVDFIAGFEAGHIFGVQFHPEKSQEKGLQLLRNYIEY
ncbi:MAG: imidazole glycerol phosphate synthase subunit HisH [bacterium]|nr:MAG: imidazole glycerol phosphate synthase subunit HisH [bacterium]